jgi:hypothetical protein
MMVFGLLHRVVFCLDAKVPEEYRPYVSIFRRMVEVVCSSETLASRQNTTLHNNPEDHHLFLHRRENIKSFFDAVYFKKKTRAKNRTFATGYTNINIDFEFMTRRIYRVIQSSGTILRKLLGR